MSVPNGVAKAYQHAHCAAILTKHDEPVQACFHLLKAISSAASALGDGKEGPKAFDELPERVFARTDAVRMTNVVAALQGIAGDDDADESRAHDFVFYTMRVVDDFTSDVSDYLWSLSNGPFPR